jgi:hypothetical protein
MPAPTNLAAGNGTVSPVTGTFVGGNVTGRYVIVCIVLLAQLTDTITQVLDGEGNLYSRVASLQCKDGSAQSVHSWWVAPVQNGSAANNTLSVFASSITNRVRWFALEYAVQSLQFDTVATTATNTGGASASYSITPATPRELLVTFNSSAGGGRNWFGLTGTDRTGVINAQVEVNDFLAVAAAPTQVTASISNGTGFGTTTAAFKFANTNALLLSGVGA